MKESQLQRKIINDLQQRECYVIKTIVSNRQGIADIIGCHKGRFIALEIKKEDGAETELQRHNREQVQKRGGLSACIYTWEQYINFREVNKIC